MQLQTSATGEIKKLVDAERDTGQQASTTYKDKTPLHLFKNKPLSACKAKNPLKFKKNKSPSVHKNGKSPACGKKLTASATLKKGKDKTVEVNILLDSHTFMKTWFFGYCFEIFFSTSYKMLHWSNKFHF